MKSSKFLSITSIIVFLLGLALFISGFNTANKTTFETVSVSPEVKVTYLFRTMLKDGSQVPTTCKTLRLVRADGSWKEYSTEFNGQGQVIKTYTQYGLNGQGVYRVDDYKQKIYYLGPRPAQVPVYNAQLARSTSDYVGKGNILGYTTVVTKPKRSDGLTLETQSAADLNGLMLKMIDIAEDHTTIIEAIDIRLEPISPQEFGTLPNYPIDTTYSQ